MYTMDTIGTVGDDSTLSIVMYTMDTIRPTVGDDSILSVVMYTMDTIGTVGDDSILSIVMYTMDTIAVSYTHLRAHETPEHLVCRLLLEKKK